VVTDLGLIAGSGWAAGLNLYAVTLVLGVAGRLGWTDVPELLTRTDVLIVAAVLYLIEFVADKVPYLDNLWDVANTVIRPLGAAALGLVLAGESESVGAAMGALVAGALALSAHGTKATTRAAVNTSPEPFSNIALSVMEDGVAGGLTLLGIFVPAAALVVALVLMVAGGFLVFKLWRGVTRLWRRGRLKARRTGPPTSG
jgi:hypothetical protein